MPFVFLIVSCVDTKDFPCILICYDTLMDISFSLILIIYTQLFRNCVIFLDYRICKKNSAIKHIPSLRNVGTPSAFTRAFILF